MRLKNGQIWTGQALRHRSLAALPAMALLAPLSALAQTQTPDDIGPEATARQVTVQNRPRPDYDPLGVRLGGFRYDASLEAGMGYDDNLQPNTNVDQSDGFFTQALNASAASTWTRHGLGLTASQETRQHLRYNDQNWLDYNIGINGRYDIGRASSVYGRYNHVRTHLAADNFDLQGQGINRPIPYDSDIFELGGTATFNRLALTPSVVFSTVRYSEQTFDGVRTNNTEDDYDSVLGSVEAAYSLVPGRSLLGLVRVQDISYKENAQSGRDSFTWEVQGGFNYDLTGLWQARVLVGYRNREYDDPSLKTLSGPAFEGQIVYLPTQLTTLTLAASRTIEESIRQDSVSYTRMAGSFTVDHELLRNVILTGQARIENRDYPDEGDVTDAIGIVNARYLINRRMSLNATYQHTERLTAPTGNREYGINQVQVRLRISL